MLKSIRIKSILAFIIVGMIIISLLGFSYIHSLENLKNELEASTEISELNNAINDKIHDAKVYVEPETFDLVQEYTQTYLDSITEQRNVGFGLKVGNNTHFVFS